MGSLNVSNIATLMSRNLMDLQLLGVMQINLFAGFREICRGVAYPVQQI